jgi:hypothetical protein
MVYWLLSGLKNALATRSVPLMKAFDQAQDKPWALKAGIPMPAFNMDELSIESLAWGCPGLQYGRIIDLEPGIGMPALQHGRIVD